MPGSRSTGQQALDGTVRNVSKIGEGSAVKLDVKDAHCISACLCCWFSPCFVDFPDCCALTGKGVCCCFSRYFHCSWLCPGEWVCGCSCCKECNIYKGIVQIFCCAAGFALPCDEEVPMMLGCCGHLCIDKRDMTLENAVAGAQARQMELSNETNLTKEQQIAQLERQLGVLRGQVPQQAAVTIVAQPVQAQPAVATYPVQAQPVQAQPAVAVAKPVPGPGE